MKIVNEKEYIIQVKTNSKNTDRACNLIREIHNYKVPAILVLDSKIMNEEYSTWFDKSIENKIKTIITVESPNKEKV